MILYLDTSSLVKLYVEEDGSSDIDILVKSSEVAVTSIIAYAEARAAFARRMREKAFSKTAHNRIKKFLDEDWPRYFILNLTEDIIRQAGDFAEKHALRGFDSIHLASAFALRQKISASVIFSCSDAKLLAAAVQEGFHSEPL
ncbi:MAG: type II toxin-antitoxin system VapC family toxin [Desulfobacterales bacterium]|nr:type II toxin-antitoxin system VapC family toxin [Desulfobacterales bacterium]